MNDPITVEIIQSIEQLPEQCLNGVLIDGMINFVSVVSNNFIKVMFGVIKSQIERHVCVVDVNIHKLHHILVRYFSQQHDFADGGGGDAITVLGLLEFLDGDGFAAVIRRRLGPGKEDEAVRALSDLPYQIVLLQPLGLITMTTMAVVVVVMASVAACAAITHALCFPLPLHHQ